MERIKDRLKELAGEPTILASIEMPDGSLSPLHTLQLSDDDRARLDRLIAALERVATAQEAEMEAHRTAVLARITGREALENALRPIVSAIVTAGDPPEQCGGDHT
jgi:hypothetical protein